LDPEAFEPLMNRGIVLFTMKKYADAEPVLRKALAIKEQSPVAHYFLGQTLAYLDRFDLAEKELRIAVETGGEQMKEAHRLLAIIYSSKGEKLRAAAELETYLKLAPKTPDAEQLRRVVRQLRGLESAPATPASATKPNN
jgi:tetratricopeptide (TPR) repeat protein